MMIEQRCNSPDKSNYVRVKSDVKFLVSLIEKGLLTKEDTLKRYPDFRTWMTTYGSPEAFEPDVGVYFLDPEYNFPYVAEDSSTDDDCSAEESDEK